MHVRVLGTHLFRMSRHGLPVHSDDLLRSDDWLGTLQGPVFCGGISSSKCVRVS